MRCREGQQDTFLHTPDVLQAFCRAVFRSKTHTNDRVRSSICNLFVQRVSSMVNMDNSVVRRIEEEIKALAGKGQVGLNGRD